MSEVVNSKLLLEYNKPHLANLLNKIYEETNLNFKTNLLQGRGFYKEGEMLSKQQVAVTETVQNIRKLLTDICINTQFIYQSILIKINYLVDAIIYAINSENLLSLARSTRSLLEHLSSLDYLVLHGNKTLEKVYDNHNDEEIQLEINKFINKYELMFYNSYYFDIKFLKEKYKGNYKRLNVKDFIDSSKKTFPNISEYYDFLCDCTHPYFGSNIFATTKSLSTEKPIEKSKRNEYISLLFDTLSDLIEYFAMKEKSYHSLLSMFAGYRSVAMLENFEVHNVFSIKKTKGRIGNGTSKESAIFFEHPRTGLEYAKSLIAYCKNNKINTKQFERFQDSDGTVYFIYEKNNQSLWIRMLNI